MLTFVRARFEVEHTRGLDWQHVTLAGEAVGPVPVGHGAAPRRLTVAVGEHIVLSEDAHLGKDTLCSKSLRCGLNIDEHDATHLRRQPGHQRSEWLGEVEQLVVVHLVSSQ